MYQALPHPLPTRTLLSSASPPWIVMCCEGHPVFVFNLCFLCFCGYFWMHFSFSDWLTACWLFVYSRTFPLCPIWKPFCLCGSCIVQLHLFPQWRFGCTLSSMGNASLTITFFPTQDILSFTWDSEKPWRVSSESPGDKNLPFKCTQQLAKTFQISLKCLRGGAMCWRTLIGGTHLPHVLKMWSKRIKAMQSGQVRRARLRLSVAVKFVKSWRKFISNIIRSWRTSKVAVGLMTNPHILILLHLLRCSLLQ